MTGRITHFCARVGSGSVLVLVTAAWLGCTSSAPPAPPEYRPLEPGTVLHYEGVTNTITAVEGMRTYYEDDQGRRGLRWGVFVSDNPDAPAQVDTATLARLWPLEPGKTLEMKVRRGEEVWRWEFRVTGTEALSVPAGDYNAYVVQGVLTPELVHDPVTAASVMNTWWYAPEVGAVVQFKTTYLSGPGAGRVVQGRLLGIDTPQAALSGG